MSIASPGRARPLTVPSSSSAGVPPPSSKVSRIGSPPESTIGRLIPDIGAAGATTIASSAGETTGPPAE